jgi:hypothetical protein
MSAPAINPTEAEQDRQERPNELTAENGPEWMEQSKPGSFGCHELLDRTSLIAANLEQFVLSHPACVQNAEWYALAEKAAAALHELYQRVGAEHLGADNSSDEVAG